MSKIKIGEYIRTYNGNIGKLVKIIPNVLNNLKIDVKKEIIHCDNSIDNFIYARDGVIVKNSEQLVDLIDEGDFVNGKLIHYVLENPKNGETMICYGNGKHIDNNHIKSIVTHEQFKRMEYKV